MLLSLGLAMFLFLKTMMYFYEYFDVVKIVLFLIKKLIFRAQWAQTSQRKHKDDR